jgi:hypothetical protein
MGVGRKYGLRINGDVRGLITLRVALAGRNQDTPTLQMQFEPSPEDRDSGHYFALLRTENGVRSGIAFIDEIPMIVGQATPAQIEAQVRRSLGSGPRARWIGLVKKLPSRRVIPGVYYEAALGSADSKKLASGTLEKLEATERAGLPSRNADPALEPELRGDVNEDGLEAAPHTPDHTADTLLGGRGNPLDLERTLAQLKGREHDIIRLHYIEDMTDAAIAAKLGITQQAVNRVRRRVEAKLRGMLGG